MHAGACCLQPKQAIAQHGYLDEKAQKEVDLAEYAQYTTFSGGNQYLIVWGFSRRCASSSNHHSVGVSFVVERYSITGISSPLGVTRQSLTRQCTYIDTFIWTLSLKLLETDESVDDADNGCSGWLKTAWKLSVIIGGTPTLAIATAAGWPSTMTRAIISDWRLRRGEGLLNGFLLGCWLSPAMRRGAYSFVLCLNRMSTDHASFAILVGYGITLLCLGGMGFHFLLAFTGYGVTGFCFAICFTGKIITSISTSRHTLTLICLAQMSSFFCTMASSLTSQTHYYDMVLGLILRRGCGTTWFLSNNSADYPAL